MNLYNKRLIIYDLDGTLVDTREDIALAANAMLKHLGYPTMEHKKVWSFVGKGLHYLIENCLETNDRKLIDQGSKVYRTYYGKHMMDHTDLYPYAREMLNHYKGVRQAVVTNKPDPFASDMLTQLAVGIYLFEIIPGNGEYPKKPNPESTFELMKKAKVEPKEVLWVGDSPIDIETARAAGVDVIALTHGFATAKEIEEAKPDAIYRDFLSILKVLRVDTH